MGKTITGKTYYLTKTFVVPKKTTMDRCKFIAINRMNSLVHLQDKESYVSNSVLELRGLVGSALIK